MSPPTIGRSSRALLWAAALALALGSPVVSLATTPPPSPPIYSRAAYLGFAHLHRFEAVARAHPGSLVDQFEAGVAAYQNDLPRQAIRYYEACLRIDPKFGQAYDEIGNVYHAELHRTKQALWDYRAATRVTPSDAAAWINIGLIEQGMHRWTQAFDAYRAATQHAPADDDAWIRLVFFAITSHHPQLAVRYARAALRTLPHGDPARPYLEAVVRHGAR